MCIYSYNIILIIGLIYEEYKFVKIYMKGNIIIKNIYKLKCLLFIIGFFYLFIYCMYWLGIIVIFQNFLF